MGVLPKEVGCLRRALENAGTLFAEVKGEVANAAQVFETLAGRAAWCSAPRIKTSLFMYVTKTQSYPIRMR